jgi:hypothetical protein
MHRTAVGHIRREFVNLPYTVAIKWALERVKYGLIIRERRASKIRLASFVPPLPIVIVLLRIIPVSGKVPAR